MTSTALQSIERFTAPTLPARVIRCETDADADPDMHPGYRIESTVARGDAHFIDRDGSWMVMPSQPGVHLTIAEMRVYIRELKLALAAAVRLEAHKPKRIPAGNAALSREIEALIADREWSTRDAASVFQMSEAALMSRLGGRASWMVTDLLNVCDGLTTDSDEAAELFVALGNLGYQAHRRSLERTVRRPQGVDDQLRSLDDL